MWPLRILGWQARATARGSERGKHEKLFHKIKLDFTTASVWLERLVGPLRSLLLRIPIETSDLNSVKQTDARRLAHRKFHFLRALGTLRSLDKRNRLLELNGVGPSIAYQRDSYFGCDTSAFESEICASVEAGL